MLKGEEAGGSGPAIEPVRNPAVREPFGTALSSRRSRIAGTLGDKKEKKKKAVSQLSPLLNGSVFSVMNLLEVFVFFCCFFWERGRLGKKNLMVENAKANSPPSPVIFNGSSFGNCNGGDDSHNNVIIIFPPKKKKNPSWNERGH